MHHAQLPGLPQHPAHQGTGHPQFPGNVDLLPVLQIVAPGHMGQTEELFLAGAKPLTCLSTPRLLHKSTVPYRHNKCNGKGEENPPGREGPLPDGGDQGDTRALSTRDGHISGRGGAAPAVLHQHEKGVGVVLIPEEAGEPGVGGLAAPHLRCPRLGAQVHIGKAAGPVAAVTL